MTIRQEMIKALSRSKIAMGDSIVSVINFLTTNINPDGGFKGRDKNSDIYYTHFGLEALIALDADFQREQVRNFIQSFTEKEPADLVHLTALIRCMANLYDNKIDEQLREKLTKGLETYRSKDGGFANEINAQYGTAYGCFFALDAYQDLKIDMPDCDRFIKCIHSLEIADGGFTNDARIKNASTNPTAAAMVTLQNMNQPIDEKHAKWLLAQCNSEGGFLAMSMAPIPDLLSTATALHALAVTDCEISSIKNKCLDFIDSLWNSKGGFAGHCADPTVDCEYTYYGLLALGHLGK